MGKITTIALLERKPSISRDLFSRYWRDVHGVMAARIPGFESYIQHHVTPLAAEHGARVEPFEGIAVVRFATPSDRLGLAESEVTRHIHRDEQNVFRRALLYNLDEQDSRILGPTALQEDAASWFIVVPQGIDGEALAGGLAEVPGLAAELFDLRHADPAGWNETDVEEGGESRLFDWVVMISSSSPQAERDILAHTGVAPCYRVDERYVMVSEGKPTLLGLRGLDVLLTIEQAGAENQRESEVLRAIYGSII